MGKRLGNRVSTAFDKPVFMTAGQTVVSLMRFAFCIWCSSSERDSMKPLMPCLEALKEKHS